MKKFNDTQGDDIKWVLILFLKDEEDAQICYGGASSIPQAQVCSEIVLDSLEDRGIEFAKVHAWSKDGAAVTGILRKAKEGMKIAAKPPRIPTED